MIECRRKETKKNWLVHREKKRVGESKGKNRCRSIYPCFEKKMWKTWANVLKLGGWDKFGDEDKQTRQIFTSSLIVGMDPVSYEPMQDKNWNHKGYWFELGRNLERDRYGKFDCIFFGQESTVYLQEYVEDFLNFVADWLIDDGVFIADDKGTFDDPQHPKFADLQRFFRFVPAGAAKVINRREGYDPRPKILTLYHRKESELMKQKTEQLDLINIEDIDKRSRCKRPEVGKVV